MAKKLQSHRATGRYARLSTFVKGAIYSLWMTGSTISEICDEVMKPGGAAPSWPAVSAAVRECEAKGGYDHDWDSCEEVHPGGRPRHTTSALDKKIVQTVFKFRGRAKVTVKFLQKTIKAARVVSGRTLNRRLAEAGLAWLRRRRKSLVPSVYKQPRLAWADWVLARTTTTMLRWMYTDGAAFYLARTPAESEDKKRGALGGHVWRMANGADALFEDCVGPSAYWKAQGACVRVWGLLVEGVLFLYFLRKGEVMNRNLYAWLIEKKFPGWARQGFGDARTPLLLQDHERALWSDEARAAMRRAGIELLVNYPKCSQDLNPIETCWRELRARLYETEPTKFETREQFIARARNAVAWLNRNRADYFMELRRDQKKRARDVKEHKGGRTDH